LAGVVLLGADRGMIKSALARHAPEVPVREVTAGEDGAMSEVVRMARDMAQPGTTVLLAPAAASMDMFVDYTHRGAAFAAAAMALADVEPVASAGAVASATAAPDAEKW
jgi:UDP-N-acetylmuramoylalanine--D-glutamate ligase